MNRRALPFALVGLSGVIVQLCMLALLTRQYQWPPAIATAVAVECAVLSNFLWHERWTWSDRRQDSGSRRARLWRFHLANGAMSMAGNVLITIAAMRLFPIGSLAANGIAIGIMSAVNFTAADRWVFTARRTIALSSLVLLFAPSVQAAELMTDTIAAWNEHVAGVEATLPSHEHDAPIASPDGRTFAVPHGTIHEWRGSIVVSGVTVDRLINALVDAGVPPPQPDVVEARILERRGDDLLVYLRLVRTALIMATYDTEHRVHFVRRSSTFATSRSVSTRIVEVGGSDRGFLWRLNSYWRYRQVGDAVQIDVLSVSLSRDVPALIRPIARPIIDRVARESMTRTLEAMVHFSHQLNERQATTVPDVSGKRSH
jgi:putative flippase GtrA